MGRIHSDLLARRRAVLPDWVALYYEEPIEIVRGEGRTVWDAEGNEYLDFFGGILTTMTGHAVPEVTAAVREQAGRILHSSTLYLDRPMIELAERVAELSGIDDARVFFATSGTEANDTALMLATRFRGSNQVLAARNSYHGRSFAALSVTGNVGWSASPLSPFQTAYVHGTRRPGTITADMDDAELTEFAVADLEDVLSQIHGRVACFIAEPVQGVGGFTMPPDGLYGRFKEILDRHDILWISDEVQTGWGRTGEHFWGWQAHTSGDAKPDIVTFAKGIGNGMSIGGIVARGEIMNCLKVSSISTFGGSPITMAAALANLDYLLAHDLPANAARVGSKLIGRFREAAAKLPAVREVRGRGLMIGVELVDPKTGEPSPKAANVALEVAKRGGVLVGKGGFHGNVLRIAPPMSLTDDEAEQGGTVIIEALRAAGDAI